MPVKLAVLALMMMVLGWTLAAQPARPNAQIVAEILKQAASAKQVETALMETFAQPKVDVKAAAAQIEKAAQNMTAIRKLLDELDARYESLTENQRSTVREAWTIAELLGSYVDGQKDKLSQLGDAELREDARVTALCAVRRATMLDETLRALER